VRGYKYGHSGDHDTRDDKLAIFHEDFVHFLLELTIDPDRTSEG
jgi:hypothetical protein